MPEPMDAQHVSEYHLCNVFCRESKDGPDRYLPPALRQRIKDFGSERFGAYEAIRVEIYNWLADNLHQSTGKLARVTDAPETEEKDLSR